MGGRSLKVTLSLFKNVGYADQLKSNKAGKSVEKNKSISNFCSNFYFWFAKPPPRINFCAFHDLNHFKCRISIS